MIRALSPEEETVQFKEKIEKKVEFRLDQSLVYVKFPSSHLQRFGQRGHAFRPFLSGGCAAPHVRKALRGASYVKEVDGYF